MSDNNAHHPGVRSLLAKFEGQSPIASPPSRGRSPASDSSITAQQLSKVRASFVTVDGIIHSGPASPLKKTNGRSDNSGMFGPTINSGDVEAGRQSAVSPTPISPLDHTQNPTLGQIIALGRPNIELKHESNHIAKEDPAIHAETAPPLRNTSPKKAEPSPADSKPTSRGTSSQRLDSPARIKKKPSSVGSARSAASKHSATTASLASAKPSTGNASPKLTAREVAKERANSLVHKPSRVSLNNKPTARPTRGPTTAQDTAKPVAGASTRTGIKSSSRPARSAPAQASTNRLGSTSAPSTRTTTATSTLTRKPSSLRSASGSQPQTTTPASSVRRQSSRPSLPAQAAQAANDPSAKPVNEGFLARMMRPTASSASKSHPQEKTDAKPVTKAASATKAPRQSIGRVPERAAAQLKPKSSTLRLQSQKSQTLHKEPAKPSQKKQESEKENAVKPIQSSPKEPAAVKSTPVVAEEQPKAAAEPVEVITAPAEVEEVVPETTIVSAESTEKSAEVPELIVEEAVAESSPEPVSVEDATEVPAQPIESNETQVSVNAEADAPVESSIEPIAEDVEEEKAAEAATATEETAAEPVATSVPMTANEAEVVEKQDAPAAEPEVSETSEPTEVQADAPEQDDAAPVEEAVVSEPLADAAEEKPTEEVAPAVQPASEAESSNVAIDIANLALN
ncbi:hypothetical protein N7457_009105 [Penicillium paradoxum]|uniref:uncharacterized protein n=1 Tax=Penicillium paradoxum TaxID=176176 RepID=UPI0025498450|nr:uncharacterized protein N7457_009105 [Penicillium paradoxum]KAJ5774209.1 hypothetical protein N7457_009105 [Penicillium paradoxum]